MPIGEDEYTAREILYDALHIDGATSDDGVLKKRLYDRQRLRDHRRRERQQIQRLRNRVGELTMELNARRRQSCASALPWREVAMALSTESNAALLTNRDLKAQLKYFASLAYTLQTYCSSIPSSPLIHILPHLTSWQHYTLPHANQARVKSMAWITEWLYHNTTMALGHCKGEGYAVDFIPTENIDLSYMIHQQQFTMPISLQDISECQRRIYLDHQCPGLPATFIDHELTLSCFGRDVSYFDLGDGLRAIYRLFTTRQRMILVCSSIFDELYTDNNKSPEYCNGWIIMDEVDDSTTKVTELFISSVYNSIDALVKLVPGAIPPAILFDDCKRQELIHHHTRAKAQENHKYCNQLFADTIQALEHDKLKMV